MKDAAEPRLLLVTGLSGAGKSTVLKVLEDLGWEVVDNLPLALLETLIDAPVKRSEAGRPLAVGIDSRSRGFRPALQGPSSSGCARQSPRRKPEPRRRSPAPGRVQARNDRGGHGSQEYG